MFDDEVSFDGIELPANELIKALEGSKKNLRSLQNELKNRLKYVAQDFFVWRRNDRQLHRLWRRGGIKND